jgi:hypothetical protein
MPYDATDTAKAERIARFCARYAVAKGHWDMVAPIVDECYEFCLPLRERPYGAKTASAKRTDRLFDTTGVHALADFASQRVEDVWPTDQKPIDLLPGREVPKNEREEARRALAEVATEVIETVNNSDFREAANEAFLDYGIVNGAMLVDEGDALEPLRHRALPFTEAVLSVGPYGRHDALYRPRKVKAQLLAVLWPDGHFTDDMKRCAHDEPDKEYEILEGYYRDWERPREEVWVYCAVSEKDKHEIARSEASGIGSQPFIAWSFMRVPGEVNGRGPAQLALPDVRSANVVQGLLLEHIDMSVGGVYQMDDNGTLNADTITIQAGVVYPRMANTKGLEAVEIGGNPQFAEIEMERLQQRIERAFFKLDLGPVDKTPKSATEILQRVADRAGRLSGPNSRLVTEFLFPYIRRVLYILRKQGRIRLPRLDGGFLAIRPLAPITRSQAQDDILRHVRFGEFLMQQLGPQMVNLIVDGERFGAYLAERMGVEPSILRTALEKKQIAQAMAQMAAVAAQQGALPGA